jgi:hypothetical protein
VYPELVIRAEAARIDGVRYDELAPMLLNDVQLQAAEIRNIKQQQQLATESGSGSVIDSRVIVKGQSTLGGKRRDCGSG